MNNHIQDDTFKCLLNIKISSWSVHHLKSTDALISWRREKGGPRGRRPASPPAHAALPRALPGGLKPTSDTRCGPKTLKHNQFHLSFKEWIIKFRRFQLLNRLHLLWFSDNLLSTGFNHVLSRFLNKLFTGNLNKQAHHSANTPSSSC